LTQPTIDLIQVVTTCATRAEAEQMAATLVDARLAACVHIHSPITSVYRWQGQIERSEEWLLTAKTTRLVFDAVAAAIRKEHSYDVPQIIALPVVAVSEDYAAWVREQVSSD
jgi:periplasmic divalent cation tolerance protein